MSSTESRISTDVDFARDGKQQGHLRVPVSTNISAYGTVPIPITQVKRGKGPTILITGGVHGDEYEGPIALTKLARRLTPAMVRGRVVLVPALNLPAALAGTRLSPMDGLNLNRVFPGEPNGSITAMIAHYVTTVLIPMADIVVDLHSGGMTLEYLPTILMHELEDESWNRQTRAAMLAFGAPIALISRELDNAVYLDTIAERLGKIALSAELGGAGRLSTQTVGVAERGVLNLLRHFGIAQGAAAERPPGRRPRTRLLQTPDRECYVIAEDTGVYEPYLDLGDPVRAGQVMGEIHSLQHPGRTPVSVVAGRDGLLLAKRPLANVSVGDCLGIVAWDLDA
jgi:N-alpha-acetyl-L-2,4-diaminobutyrate deacetylase